MYSIWTILTVILFVFYYGCTALNTYYMDDLCGKTLKLSAIGLESAVLKLTKHEKYTSTMNCITTIMATHNKQIMLKYIQMDIRSYHECPGDYLAVYDGHYQAGSRNIKEPMSVFCGDDTPRLTYSSTGQYLTLRFVSDDSTHGEGFEVVLTAFHNGSCSSSEYQCDNRRCISQSLVCNGYNNCGDYSDWCVLSPAVISGIVIACFVAVITIWVCMVFVWYAYTYRQQRLHRRTRRRNRPQLSSMVGEPSRYSHLLPPESSSSRRDDVFTIFPQLRISITPVQPPPYPGEPSSEGAHNLGYRHDP